MKDRTPKFPGRVKLKPVAGQTDTYDMTRADDPDDTGTPFNTRTMLQDSTGRFLRLPVSNPFVDDALRHMPDRIEPIGTVKTSPALSLGDAWLPCDGSQVTFAEYPALCQLLRGVAGTDVEWDSTALGTTGVAGTITGPVFFDGKWKLAMAQPSVGSGTNYTTYPITVLTADALTGPWSVEYQVNKDIYSLKRVWIAATEDACIVAFPSGAYHLGIKLTVLYRKTGASNWSEITAVENFGNAHIFGVDAYNGEFAIAYPNSNVGTAQAIVLHTSTPDVKSSWASTTAIMTADTVYNQVSFSHAGDKWILAGATSENNGGTYATFVVAYSGDTSGFQFTRMPNPVTVGLVTQGVNNVSRAVFYNGKFYVLLDGYVGLTGANTNKVVLASSVDLLNWEFQAVGTNTGYTTEWMACDIAASDKMMAFANKWNTWVSSDPVAKVNKVTLPSGAVSDRLIFDGNTVYGFSNSAVVYHDYSTETRLLPEISLSDDTTTYIKAKNELDVFEAQESGG